ncbi:MAG: histidine kinase [Bacteroidota bacterium]
MSSKKHIVQNRLRQGLAFIIVAFIVAYLLLEWVFYFRSIEDANRSEFIGFVYFVASYCLVLCVLVLLGWLVFKLRLYLTRRQRSWTRKEFLAIHLCLYLCFFLLLRRVFSGEDQFVPENMLLAGVGVAIIIVAERLFSANKQKQLQLIYERERQKAELAMIKAQVNPHFLFNSLNTLYNDALKIGAADMTSNLEKLTDILRYQLQYASQPFISLEEETNFIQQFVDFHKHRFTDDESVKITLEITVDDRSYVIRPMMLITFIENAFKHGISREKPSVIDISLHGQVGELTLQVINTNHPKVGKMSTGIGLSQTLEMLKAYYPKHTLQSTIVDDHYKIILTLPLENIQT